MKKKSHRVLSRSQPSEEDIRSYAYHLYQQSNCLPGHDLGNWLEATACLNARIPADRSHTRLHHHLSQPVAGVIPAVAGGPMPARASARVLRRPRARSRQ